MAKFSNVLRDIRDRFNEFDNVELIYSTLENNDHKLKEFISIFDGVEDSRMKGKCIYSTMTIVGIVFLGLLHNMDTWQEIASFACRKKEFLSKYLDLSKGVPSHDTLERVFSLINCDTLEKALVDFIERSIETTAQILDISSEEMKILAIDGKELKGSGRKYYTPEKIKNSQIMHFYDVSTGICIKSQMIEDKTNEIPTAQKMLSTLNIKGVTVTSDAMNCQKKTVEAIIDAKAHYVLGLKGNHSDFYNEIKDAFNRTKKFGSKSYFKMETEKNHNQVEVREFYKISAKTLVFAEGWKNIKNVVMYKKTMTNNITGEVTVEKRYYITDLNDIELISHIIRRHWAVENELHWHMDVSLSEDANKTINKKALNNLSTIKKNVLTILKLLQPLFGNNSIKVTRKLFVIDYEINIIKLFALLDEHNLKELIRSK